MPLFDTDNRLRSDPCAVRQRDLENFGLAGYTLLDQDRWSIPICPEGTTARDCLELESKIRSGDGFGIRAAEIDGDSSFRNNSTAYTHGRTRQSLSTRVFGAAPDRGRGGLAADVESRLTLSGGVDRDCTHRYAEVNYDRFDPGVRPVGVQHVVVPFPAGRPSRDIARSPAFLATIGYECSAPRRHGGGGAVTKNIV